MTWSDPEYRKQYHREYYKVHKKRWKELRKKPTEEARIEIRKAAFEYRLRTIYGMSKDEYDILLEKQDGKCAICKTREVKGKAKQMHVDHCHTPFKVRGLLCMRCNTALGWFEKNSEAISKYVEDA